MPDARRREHTILAQPWSIVDKMRRIGFGSAAGNRRGRRSGETERRFRLLMDRRSPASE
jgi:hypothetical protein